MDYKAAIHITADQRVAYNRYPPVGGPHDGTWANCNGIVYATAVRNENMVHTLEHGAVWITYNPDTISPDDLATLTALVQDQPFTTLSPYPGLDSTISLQAWAHQLKVDSASDERVEAVHHRAAAEPLGVPGDRRDLPAAELRRDEPAGVRPDPARRRRDPDVRHRRHRRHHARWPSRPATSPSTRPRRAPVSTAEAPTSAEAPAEPAVTTGS